MLSGMAALLSAVTARSASGVGLPVDWPYQLPVALASVMGTVVLPLSWYSAVPGGGGAMTKTSCWPLAPASPPLRE
ncbi:hypothetical protein D3C81_2224230 [compost metagenome]